MSACQLTLLSRGDNRGMAVATTAETATRRWKGYPAHRDSGVEWLGEVPAHWDVRRLKQVARLESGHTPSRAVPEYWENCTIPWVSLADVGKLRGGDVDYVDDTVEYVSELGLANSSARLLPAGTVILSRTASVGFSAILGQPNELDDLKLLVEWWDADGEPCDVRHVDRLVRRPHGQTLEFLPHRAEAQEQIARLEFWSTDPVDETVSERTSAR